MDGLSSFYPVVEGIDYLVNSDTEVALFHFFNVHSYQEYECKVNKDFKKYILKTSSVVGTNSVFNLLAFKDSHYNYFSCILCLR